MDADQFLEYAQVYGDYYGTPKHPALDHLSAGRDVLLEIDVQGALKVMELYPDAITIFLMPPSWETLEQRLRNRKTDAEATIQRRLAKAREELQFADRYRHRVINHDLDKAVRDVAEILSAQRS